MDKEFITFLSNLGKQIKQKRLEAGLTQEQMEGDGLYVRYIQEIESGKNVTIRTLFRLSRKLGVPVKDFFETG